MAQIISAISDIEGGPWILAIMIELFEELFAAENYKGCHLVIHKIFEVALMCPGKEYEDNELSLILFAIKESLLTKTFN